MIMLPVVGSPSSAPVPPLLQPFLILCSGSKQGRAQPNKHTVAAAQAAAGDAAGGVAALDRHVLTTSTLVSLFIWKMVKPLRMELNHQHYLFLQAQQTQLL